MLSVLCVSVGMFITHRSKVCRHSEGQGAEAHGPAAAAADAAAQRCVHVGKPHRAQQPWSTVSCSEYVCLALFCLSAKDDEPLKGAVSLLFQHVFNVLISWF